MSKKIGIDLGTSYTCVSYLDDRGDPKILDNYEGEQTTPMIVFLSDIDEVVGTCARASVADEFDNVVEGARRYLGDPAYRVTIGGKEYSPEYIIGLIFKRLIKDAQYSLGERPGGAVITVPAYYGEDFKKIVDDVASEAGVNVFDIIEDPYAAALAYGWFRREDINKTVLIYDLGGFNFDCTILKVNFKGAKQDIKIVHTGGEYNLGGKDWDEALEDYIVNEFCAITGDDPNDMLYDPDLRTYLDSESERVKKLLSYKTSVPLMVDYNGVKKRIVVTREAFERQTEGLLTRTIEAVDKMLSEHSYSLQHDIGEIWLAGGSCLMPQVKERLLREYGLPVYCLQPDKIVAMGAVLYTKRYGGLSI